VQGTCESNDVGSQSYGTERSTLSRLEASRRWRWHQRRRIPHLGDRRAAQLPFNYCTRGDRHAAAHQPLQADNSRTLMRLQPCGP
jgi:hypothetical protein